MTDDTIGFTGPAEDQAQIRALHDCYADAVNRRDAAAWGALWAEDARWELMGMQVDGRAQIGAIVVTGDRAEGRVWTHELLDGPEGERRPLGRYDDVYVKRGDSWLFAERRFNLRRP
jgi:hypothetical protein